MVQSYSPGGANVPSRVAHWHNMVNVIEFVFPSVHPSPQPKWQIDRFSLFVHSSWQSVVRYIGATWRIQLKLCTMALPCVYLWTCASFGPPESTTETANQPFLHNSWQKVSILYNRRPFPQKLPLLMGICTPSNSRFLGPVWAHNPSRIMIGSDVCIQVTAEYPYTLQWAGPPPSKLPIPINGSGPQSNIWFPGPTKVLNPSGISIGSVVFVRLSSVTDRETDRQTDRPTDRPCYSVGNNRLHLRT